MNESTRTMSFLGAAVASLVLAFFFAPATPRPPDDFSEVGKPFYNEFDVSSAKSLMVVSFSDNAMEPKTFRVEQKDNKWGILLDPRNNVYYPADGEDRLAKTAASVLDVTREQFVTKDPEQYPALRVVDPLETDVTKLLGRGRRVTLKDGDDNTLADYIIGNKVPKRPNDGGQVYYYVRKPDDKKVYTAKLNIDLSTKFADWIESNLLKLQGDNIVEMMAHKYTLNVNPLTGGASLKGEETNILTRDKPNDPWKLEGLDQEKEEVNQEEVNAMTRALEDLKIIGARPKPEQLTAELKSNRKIEIDENSWRELASKGFYQTPDERFLSSEGQVETLTDAGVKYTFRFGNSITASEDELESGLEGDKKEGDQEAASKKGAPSQKGRYVFITTEFVEQGLGPKPKPPVKEVIQPATEKKPEEEKPEVKSEEPKGEQPPAAEAKPVEKKPAVAKPDEPKPEAPKPEAPKAEAPKAEDKPKAEAEKVEQPEPKTSEGNSAVKQPEATQPEAKKTEAPANGETAEGDQKCGEDENAAEAKPETPKTDDVKSPAAEKPAAEKPAVEAPKDVTEKNTEKPVVPAGETPEPKASETKTPEPKTTESKPAEPKGPTPEQQAEANFKQAQAQYEKDLKAYEEKVVAGKKKVKELNARFADWYYVISDENFQKLRLSRKGLVKPKTQEKPEGTPGSTPQGLLPGVKLPNGILPPDLTPETEAEKPKSETPPAKSDTEKPEVEKPAEEKKPEATKPAEEKPAVEKPAEEKPVEEKPAEEKKPEATKPAEAPE